MIQNLVRIGKLNSLQLLGGFMLKMRMALELMLRRLAVPNYESRGGNSIFAKNVLDNIQPPKCLSIPYIFLCGCKVSNMDEQLKKKSFRVTTFPKSLKLDGMPRVKWLESKFSGDDKYNAFPSLELLYIKELEALEDWLEAKVAAKGGCLFP
ncbi:hypothetical protein IEQ34_016983 [Dendrobium chrysotoxum]|uniref:Uncharacterized protein n=1 Tax=Dendrobium chrysotoxum TaxID=161865 RepID=A0AAV7GHE4_DENCH|nr:hypothetical protein IEQ34_016983 [Dendrobium chrysotoxum]